MSETPDPVPATHPDRGDLTDLRAEMEADRVTLAARVDELAVRADERNVDDNFADSAQVAAGIGENKLLYDQLRGDLDDIEKALTRMDDGTYGTCEICGAVIGAERLEAMPATALCIDHA